MKYKKAALDDHLGKIMGTSAGALAGGLGGYGFAAQLSDNKSIKILAALAGALGGGYLGHHFGNYVDNRTAGLVLTNKQLTSKAKQLKDDKELFRMLSEHRGLLNTGLKLDRGLFKKWYEDNLALLENARGIVNDIINNGGQVDQRLVLLLNKPAYGKYW